MESFVAKMIPASYDGSISPNGDQIRAMCHYENFVNGGGVDCVFIRAGSLNNFDTLTPTSNDTTTNTTEILDILNGENLHQGIKKYQSQFLLFLVFFEFFQEYLKVHSHHLSH